MTPQTVGMVFKRVARTLNIAELDPAHISSHSARIGATQDLVEESHGYPRRRLLDAHESAYP
jgi:hypothetical protein